MRRWFAVAFTSVLLCGWYPITFQVLEAIAADAPIQLPPVVVEESPIAPTAKPERLYKESEAREAIERTPGGVALIDSETITESLGTNFKDVLDFVPGVFVQPRQGGTTEESQFSIRGSGLRNNFHIRGINILQDGFILNNADGFFRPEVLEFSATKRVEVFKGANGLRFGSNSLGGAINLVTTTGRDSPPVDLWSEGGSFGFFKNYLATGNIFGPFDLYGGFTYTRADGYRDHSNTDRQRILSTVGYQFEGGTDLRLDLGYVRDEQALPGYLASGIQKRPAPGGPRFRGSRRTPRLPFQPCRLYGSDSPDVESSPGMVHPLQLHRSGPSLGLCRNRQRRQRLKH